jgi:hypothetical protein
MFPSCGYRARLALRREFVERFTFSYIFQMKSSAARRLIIDTLRIIIVRRIIGSKYPLHVFTIIYPEFH